MKLRQNGYLREYLEYFPEDLIKFNEYREFYYELKNNIYDKYVSKFIKKEECEIEYELKPLIYGLHTYYKETGQRITMSIVKEYLHDIDGKRLLFIRRYMGL